MSDVFKWLNKYGVMVIIFLLLVIALQHCNQNSKLNANIKNTAAVAATVDSLIPLVDQTNVAKKVELLLVVNKFETAKLILYDWNSVVRTVVRPDDLMNEYDDKIRLAKKELRRFEYYKD